MNKRALAVLALALLTAAAALAAGRAGAPAHTAPAASAQASSTGGMPFSIVRALDSFEGTAAEVIPVSGYVYVLVDTGREQRWVVSLKKPVARGAHVSVHSFGTQKDFESPKLHRVFSQLWFAVISVQ